MNYRTETPFSLQNMPFKSAFGIRLSIIGPNVVTANIQQLVVIIPESPCKLNHLQIHVYIMIHGKCVAPRYPVLPLVDSKYQQFQRTIHQSLGRLILPNRSPGRLCGSGYVVSWDFKSGERFLHR